MSAKSHVTAVSVSAPYLVNLDDHAGHQWRSDEPRSQGGADQGPNPHQLLLSSFGACTAITLRMYAASKGWALTGVEVDVQFNPDGDPPQGGNDIRRRIALKGELTTEQRQRLLEIAERCPIHKVLTGEIRIASALI